MAPIELGLIGSGIERSMAPMLHEALGQMTGRPVWYVLHDLDPNAVPEFDLAALLDRLARSGVLGVNVTHPFKEHAAGLVALSDSSVASIGAANTVRFGGHGPVGHNTDHSGFICAYRRRFGNREPGVVALLGAGGAGRATAFALATLGARALRIHDPEAHRAERLAEDLAATAVHSGTTHRTAEDSARDADGIMNCSPVGMHHHPGCPIDSAAFAGLRWAFDAVYSPARTEFLLAAERAGAESMGGAELFFWQGIDAFRIFHETELDDETIRAAAKLVRAEIAERNRP